MNQVTQYREEVMALEQAMRQMPGQFEPETLHYFSDGLYGREWRAPAGTIAVGKIHKRSCINIILAGEVEVRSISGPMRIKAPNVFVSKPGDKRAVYVVEDAIWVTVHASKETDLLKLEADLIAGSFESLPETRIMIEGDL